MKEITLDKSRAVRFHARVSENSIVKTLTFLNADGTDHDIEDYDFRFVIQYKPNTNKTILVLTDGNGLTSAGNVLSIQISAAQATVPADTYFYRLVSDSEGSTWLNGAFEFHNGEFDLEDTESDITINPNGDTVIIEIQGGAGASDNKGDWDGFTTLPSSAQRGNRWRLSNDLDIEGKIFAAGTMIEAAEDNPTDLSGWVMYAIQQ